MSIIKESGWHENDVQLRVNSKSVLGNGVMTKGYYLVIRDKTTCGCIIPIHERAMKALVIEGIIKLTGVFQCSTLIPGICYF
mgnify:CR=1 FL=1|jgi:hypothetical protein